jgi:hypothetical protein
MTPERLLSLATAGIPPRRAAWGAAMRAELAAIDEPAARRRFARSAAAAAFAHGYGVRIALALGVGVIVAAVTLVTSRVQLHDGGPGVLLVTVPVPAFCLLAVAFVSARWARAFRFGLETGLLAFAASCVAVSSVVALEGLVWMERHGVFMLDGDPPRHAVGDADVIFDLFTTGMWLGHVLFWLPWPAVGAWLGRARDHEQRQLGVVHQARRH